MKEEIKITPTQEFMSKFSNLVDYTELPEFIDSTYVPKFLDSAIWQWIEERLKKEHDVVLEMCSQQDYTRKWAHNKAIDDAIAWFGDELDRLIRTKQIDMIHTNLDKIMEDAKKKLKEK